MTTDAITPPALQPVHAPTAKERRYDRQLRLWAASGQQALEEAHVLLLNSGTGTVGTETLKNLVLPGMGNFTIVDGATVTEEDLGVNFFLEESSLGKSRAEECAKFLVELNPEVNGSGVQQNIHTYLNTADISAYTLILLCGPLGLKDLVALRQKTFARSKPLVRVDSAGFYSLINVQLPPLFPIVDTHPDPVSTQDLRLLAPWPELATLAASRTSDLSTLSDHDHGHVPYLLLLLHHLKEWKASHNDTFPSTYKEKTEFRTFVRNSARTNNSDGGEENYDEAVAAVLKSLNPPSIPSGLKEIFAEPECKQPTSVSADFWLIANAMEQFVSKHGVLPLPGAIPDMKAQSNDYIELQNVYKSKARADVAEVTSQVRELEAKLRAADVSSKSIDAKEIEAFCKGAAFVKLVRGRISGSDSTRNAQIAMQLGDEESLYPIVLAFEAFEAALDPLTAQGETDVSKLVAWADREGSIAAMESFVEAKLDVLKAAGADVDPVTAKIRVMLTLQELQRAGPTELHNIASLTGGMVAQEIIKVLTKQYVPLDNTCVFDGVNSKSGQFRL